MSELPGGTVTFLFTDIEGSAKLWEQHPEPMRAALSRHDSLLRQTLEAHGGYVFKTVGDAFCAAFPTAPEALTAALAAQRELNHGGHGEKPGGTTEDVKKPDVGNVNLSLSSPVSPVVNLRVRMALHTGAAEVRDNDYFGQPLNRVARLLATGHGGQILLSDVTQELCRDALSSGVALKDLGEHRLRDLSRAERVFQLLHPDLRAEFPPLKSLDNPALPNNLPQQLTSFVGREREIGEVKRLLAQTRLLTLTGSGGCGKTRLSLQVAADVLEEYADGARLVELAPLADPALLPHTIAHALDIQEQSGRTIQQILIDSLKFRQLLLVLDNCEHLLDACAHLADNLLRSCPKLRILATSREGLGIVGEQRYRVPPLSLPDPKMLPPVEALSQYEAVTLFLQRARLVEPAFALTDANASAVAQICYWLDGMPLAIELAAARVRSLPVEQIMARLGDRFRLLKGGGRTTLPRHQTLRALIDWSHDLLTEPERLLLRRLSVFLGGCTLEAAEAVCAGEEIEAWEILDLLTSLEDKSLVVVEMREGTGRYRLLETIRQYGQEKLEETGKTAAIQARHADCYRVLVEKVAPRFDEADGWQAMNQLEVEYDNVRVALTWYHEEDAETGLRLCNMLSDFWDGREYVSEGRTLFDRMLELTADKPTSERAKALLKAGGLAITQDEDALGRTLYDQSLALYRELDDTLGSVKALSGLSRLAQRQTQPEEARAFCEQALALGREKKNKRAIVIALKSLAGVERQLNEAWS